MKFYTHFTRQGNYVLERGYENGKRYSKKIEYNPVLFVSSKTETEFKTLNGNYVSPVEMGTMRDAGEFIKRYEEVENFPIYGSTNYQYIYINEQYLNEIVYEKDLICIANIDIEVESENGFPEPDKASEPILAITIKVNNTYHVFGCGKYDNYREDVTYNQCRDENDLIMRFLELWEQKSPDIITGWNVQFFDIPYIYNRICRLIGETTANRLSPYKMVNKRMTKIMNREQTAFDIVGISTLDYLELYKKFTYSQQETFRLDHIAYVELGENKLDYTEYETLHQLYKHNYQKFIEYNIKDVELVWRLDEKMKFIDMVLALAYDAKVNMNDVFTQVRMWDILTHNALWKKGIIVPQKKTSIKTETYEGAYVKEPVPGKYKWVVSFDLNSLYPHLIMQYNISPETIIDGKHTSVKIEDLLSRKYENNSEYVMAANGHYFRKDVQGFLPEMMQRMYDDRVLYKTKMIDAQKELEKVTAKLKELT